MVRQIARGNNGIFDGDYTALDITETENGSKFKKEAEEPTFQRMARAHDFLEMWQGSQNLCATQKESRSQNKQMTAVGYTSDAEEIIKASWSNVQQDGAAAFKLLQRSPLPPVSSAKNLPGGQTQVFTLHPIKRINCHPAESDEECAPQSISNTESWLNWNGDFDNPNLSKDDWEADNKTDVKRDTGIKDLEIPAHLDVNAAPNVPRLIWPTQKSMKQSDKGLMMVTVMETRRRKGNKKQ